jgi:hypothetical protein
MIRAFHTVIESEDRGQRTEFSISVFCLLISVFCFLVSCAGPEEEPVWGKVNIGDLAPYDGGKLPHVQLLKTINLDIHVFEIPADNVGELDDIHRKLQIKPLQLKNYRAFSDNSFLARFGQFQMWSQVHDLLFAADGQRIAKVSLMLPDGQPQTIAIAGLDRPRTIFFTAIDGSRQGANVGPGVLGLRIKADRIPGSRGACDVVGYPVFSLPIRSTIPQFDARTKLRDFAFTVAAFGLKMSPGDFVFLAPKEYVSDQTALAGLFFSNPGGNLFFNKAERKPPEYKPAVRVFLLVCTKVDY